MAQWHKFVLYYLWVAPHLLLAALPLLMLARRLHRKFPVFFAYSIYETLGFTLLFSTYVGTAEPRTLYRHIFIATLPGSIALRFGIIQEIFNNVFHDYPRLENLVTASRRWLTGILVLVAIWSALFFTGPRPDDVMGNIAVFDRSVAIIQVGLLLLLFLFSRWFGLSWRSYVFGTALGFAIVATTELAVWAIRLMDLSEPAKNFLDLLPTGSYHVTVLVWLGYLLAAEKVSTPANRSTPGIDQWSGELERYPQ
jgi:hypothetical protein